MLHGNFDNTGKLCKLIIRRERVVSLIWILILVMFSISLAPAMSTMFPDQDSRNGFAESFDNPMMVAMMGPVYGADNYTEGAMYSGMMLLWTALAVAIMNIFFVVRHTRGDEDHGRAEVVRSLPTGRLANVNATMLSALALNATLAVLTGFGLAAMGVESIDFAGSMLYGAALGALGLVFAAIAALFSQLSSSSGGANVLSLVSMGILYMIRAAGDGQSNEILSCISPLGLVLRSQAYIENNVWPTLILLLMAVIISAVAYKLNSMRDLGQGFIAAKPGRAEATKGLQSSFGLAWRLMRFMLIGWFIVLFVLGASYGSVVADISGFIGDSPEYMQIIGVPVEVLDTLSAADQERLIVESFGGFVTVMMTLVAFVPVLIAAMKARSEEREGRAEHIVSRSVSRVKYLAGHVTLAYIASAFMQFATAAGLYLSAASLTGESNPFNFGEMLRTYFSFLPAIWVMIGIAVLLVGLFPKATGVTWGCFGVVFFTSFVGGMALPEWMLNISPLHHISVPQPFQEFTMDFAPLIILTAIAAVLTAIGLISYKKRDIMQ